MNKVILTLCAISLLSACSGTKSANNANGTQKVASNKNIVCERTAGTGSHLKKKTCMTRAQAKALKQQSQEDMRRAQKHINDSARQ